MLGVLFKARCHPFVRLVPRRVNVTLRSTNLRNYEYIVPLTLTVTFIHMTLAVLTPGR